VGYTREFSIAARAVVAALLGCAVAYVVLLLLKNHLPSFQSNFVEGFDTALADRNCDFCKKAFYGSFFLSGPIAAAAAFYATHRSSGSLALSAITASFVYLALDAANDAGSPGMAIALLAAGAITVGVNRGANNYFPPAKPSTDTRFSVGAADLLAIVFLALLLIPSDLEGVTAAVRDEAHKVSYFIGPALTATPPVSFRDWTSIRITAPRSAGSFISSWEMAGNRRPCERSD
jgi:hypothetical protein